jgi:hypothetical protein
MQMQLLLKPEIAQHLNVHFLIQMLEETILHQILLELGMVVEEEQHKQLSI